MGHSAQQSLQHQVSCVASSSPLPLLCVFRPRKEASPSYPPVVHKYPRTPHSSTSAKSRTPLRTYPCSRAFQTQRTASLSLQTSAVYTAQSYNHVDGAGSSDDGLHVHYGYASACAHDHETSCRADGGIGASCDCVGGRGDDDGVGLSFCAIGDSLRKTMAR